MNHGLRHFLGDIRRAVWLANNKATKTGIRNPKVTLESHLTKEILPFWLHTLQKAKEGFSMNNLVYRDPTIVHSADASMFGIGIVNFTNGKAYRWLLPEDIQFNVHINILEFTASIMALLLDDEISPQDCILSKTDNSSAAGWLNKSNFDSKNLPTHMALASLLGHDLLDRGYCLYSQHWPGTDNVVCDSLSRDFHLSDNELTAFLHFACPEQLPPNFHICRLPDSLSSKISSLLQTSCETRQSRKVPTRSTLWLGKGGIFSANNSASPTMSTSQASTHLGEPFSSARSPPRSAKATSPTGSNPVIPHSWPTPSKVWSTRWQRPSRMLSGPTPDSTVSVAQVPFYLDSGAATEIKTVLQELRRPSRAPSSNACGSSPPQPKTKLSPA
jgi:hypothetical protein